MRRVASISSWLALPAPFTALLAILLIRLGYKLLFQREPEDAEEDDQ